MRTSNASFQFSPAVSRRVFPSATLAMNERVAELWAARAKVFHLAFGESRFPAHPKIIEALKANADKRSYLPSQGLLELRERVSEFYATHFKLPVSPNEVIVGPGSKSLIYALLQSLTGDVILPTPSWVSYAPQARLVGKRVRWIPSSPAEGNALKAASLRKTLRQSRLSSANSRILILNSPNNPTGAMLEPGAMKEIAGYCRAEGIIVLSDEIYGLVTHGRKPHESFALHYPEGTVVLGGLSKHLSLGGWRLGVAIVPASAEGKRLMGALKTVASEIWSSAPSVVQYAAIKAYSDDPEITAYIRECTQIHALRTQYLWNELKRAGIDCPQPDGAFYLYPNFDRWRKALTVRGVNTSDDLAAYLLQEYELATLPGSAFGAPRQELSLRLSSSFVDMETDERAEAVLCAFRSGMSTDDLMQNCHPSMNAALGQFRRFVCDLTAEAGNKNQ